MTRYRLIDTKNKYIDKSIKKNNIYIAKSNKRCYDKEEIKDYLLFTCDNYEEMEEIVGNDEGRRSIMEV